MANACLNSLQCIFILFDHFHFSGHHSQNTQRLSSSQSTQSLATPVVSVTTPSLPPQGLVYSAMPTAYNTGKLHICWLFISSSIFLMAAEFKGKPLGNPVFATFNCGQQKSQILNYCSKLCAALHRIVYRNLNLLN